MAAKKLMLTVNLASNPGAVTPVTSGEFSVDLILLGGYPQPQHVMKTALVACKRSSKMQCLQIYSRNKERLAGYLWVAAHGIAPEVLMKQDVVPP